MSETDIVDVNDARFESEVLQADKPVVVDFWAEWSGPGRMVEPVLDDLADSYAGAVRVVRVDVDRNPQTASYYGVDSIPTFLRFVDGEVTDRLVGAVSKPRLERLFES